ncbi:MAG: hypothetical protein IJ309_04965 [Clostridia bacterium]|nr:hypothetical protein [Clostridia bacterium]
MKKLSLRILILALCLLLMLPVVSSCNQNEAIYTLGAHCIMADEYYYLLSMFKRQLMASFEVENESDLSYEVADGMTLGQYWETVYRPGFEQSVLRLLFSQALFEEYGLSVREESKNNSDNVLSELIKYYGGFNEKYFDKYLENYGYGFSADTIRRVYDLQLKESAVMDYLYGLDYSKVTKEQKDSFYKDNYMHFQVLVINTLYKKHEDSLGNVSYINLTEAEMKYKKQLVNELTELLVSKNESYDYKIIDPSLSYEELWEEYSDDKEFSQGWYMQEPTSTQMATSSTLATALVLRVGDCGVVDAKRYFDGDGTIKTENGEEEIKEGDYFTYGSAFIKKLSLDNDAYLREENKDFFDENTFLANTAEDAFLKKLNEYESQSGITAYTSSAKDSYTLDGVMANELDYYYFYGSKEQ